MSRTHKDVARKNLDPEYERAIDYEIFYIDQYSEQYDFFYTQRFCFQKPGVKTKKKRYHNERHYMPTPNWWVRVMMNQPQRVKGHQWEKKILKVDINDIDIIDYPTVGRKPHIYFW